MFKKILFIVLLFSIKQINAQVCFGSATNFGANNGPQSVISADFNGDGFKDLAVTNYSSNDVSVLLGTGTGIFGTATNFAVGGGPTSVTSADFNGDGKADLATANSFPNNVSILLGNGAGSFGAATNFAAGTNPQSVCNADFNGDGKVDLAVANWNSNNPSNVSVILGNGVGSFGAPTNFAVGSGPFSVISADFNGDNKADLATANRGSNNVSVLLGNGAGSFGAATNFATGAGTAPDAVISADLNGDGKKDLAVSNQNTNNLSVLLGTGTGNFGAATNFAVGTNPYSIINADFNGDTKVDLATANNGSGNVSVLLGNGLGSFGVATNFTVGSGIGSGNSIVSADFNGDSKADLATAANNVSILLNNLPNPNVGGTTTICSGNNTTLIANGASTYYWNPAVTVVNTSGTTQTVTATPSVTTTYTITGGNSGCTYSLTALLTVTVNTTPTVTANASPSVICATQSTTLTAGGATNYTWMPGNLTGSSVSVTLNATTGYTVTGDNGSCSAIQTLTVTVDPNPTVTVTPAATAVCYGDPVTLTATASGAVAPYSFAWSNGINSGSAVFTPTITATYTVTATSSMSLCQGSTIATVTVNPLPTINAVATSTLICSGKPVTLTASGNATTYTWTNGITNGVAFNPTVTATYTATGTDANNCHKTTTVNVNVPAAVMPFICMLTADSLALNNIIYWDKSLYPGADSFIVYRYDAFSTTYFRLGAVKKDSGHFVDTQRNIGGPNGGDPQYGSWQYKLAIRDTCGNISAKSPYHQSVFVQENLQNFSWNAYTIESGQSNPVTGYAFSRDDMNMGSWHVLINTAGLSSTDPNYLSYPMGNWRVDAFGFNCVSSLRTGAGTQSAVVRSKSNITNNRTTGNTPLTVNSKQVSVYPNPTSNGITISSATEIGLVIIYNSIGEIVYSEKINSTQQQLDLSKQPAGIYILQAQGAHIRLLKE